MASIAKDANGRKRLIFSTPGGARKTIRLGKIGSREAEGIKRRVESLVACMTAGVPWDQETSRWVATLPDHLADKLASAGFLPARKRLTLGPFLDDYIRGRIDLKPLTIDHLRRAQRDLLGYFGPDKLLAEITPGDADEFRLYLIDRGLDADSTVPRICGRAKQFLTAAVKHRLIPANPFADLKSCVQANRDRFYFSTRDEIALVLNACPDAEWRLIVALSRFGGLRCPSEHLALRWGDVAWDRNRITVRSPKTEHHPGGESRVIPLFPELLPHLEDVFDAAASGTEYVITRYRQANSNLRTQLQRIIRKAGLRAWPKLFQNLRSSRETELAETFPIHVVCRWIGNSQAVAAKHYLQVTDAHFDRAVSGDRGVARNAAQSVHELGRIGPSGGEPHEMGGLQNSPPDNALRPDTTPDDEERLPQAPRPGLEPGTSR